MTENRSGDATGPGPESQPTPPALDEVLAAAARPAPVEPEPAERALAAFRAARAEGALSLPTRPEDDWRTAPPPRIRARGLKVGIGALVAGVMFGGVAMAAGAIPVPFGEPPAQRPGPVPGAPSDGEPPPETVGEQAAPPTAGTSAAPWGEHPPTAKDEEAHCRAYDKARRRNDAAVAGAMRERLEEAAGGPHAVAAYCDELLAESDAGPGSGGRGPKQSRPPAADAPDTPPGKDMNDSPRHRQFPKD
ncbi:hypothetical protein HW130_09425 [Streptomyces sp. PKU-EA00015]|uniref:hypothetical protein n=1 Tax=Streptomyces sp. PKU-EA00015 TaxID=2748326 RepID=UPI0015A00CA7|nr:hypothetical protein [Streptomyces sp. PKU-EA00015]NWF26491.1 hypothetical protein [Streptomyces sp. PKU-EA00015]